MFVAAGLEMAEIEAMMRPFQMTAQRRGGTGLGLSISTSLVRLWGGTFSIHSQVGQSVSQAIGAAIRSSLCVVVVVGVVGWPGAGSSFSFTWVTERQPGLSPSACAAGALSLAQASQLGAYACMPASM